MKVELSEGDIQNLIVIVHRATVTGDEQDVATMLKAKLRQALQGSREDGAKPAEEIPAEEPTS